ncbi:MAG: hypothetical protein AAFQ87_26060 [Bacteroidota bacterium]
MKTSVIKRNYDAIKQKTGIDFEQYKEESWGETIANLVFFPQYAISNILKGPGLLLLIVFTIAIICMFTEHKTFGFFFLIFGIVFGIINGFYLGCIWFVRSLTSDINSLLNLTLQKSGSIINSFNDPEQKAAYQASLIDIVRGVIFSMILPEVNKVISKKVPFIGGVIAWLSGQAIGKMANNLESKIKEKGDKEEISEQAAPAQQLGVLSKVEKTADKVADTTASIASFPFKLLLGIFGMIWAGITAFLYWTMF